MKKSVKVVLLVLFLALVALGIYLFINPKKALNIILPEADSINDLAINLSGDTAYIDLSIHVKNKSLFKLSIDSLVYKVKLDTSTMLSKSQFVNQKLEISESDTIVLSLALPYKRLSRTIKSLQGKDSMDIDLDLKLVYATIFGETTLPYQKTIRMEVPQPPKFEVLKVELLNREKKTAYFMVDILMHNYGKIDLNVSDLKYTMKAEDLFVANGRHTDNIVIKPKSNLVFKLPVKVEFKKVFKTLSRIVTNKDQVNYALRVTALIQNDRVGSDKTPLEVEKQGVLELKK